jgi:hypothetical protein
MLEEGDQRDCGHQDPEEPSQLCQTGTDRGLHPLQAQVTLHSPFTTCYVTALSLLYGFFPLDKYLQYPSFLQEYKYISAGFFLLLRHFRIFFTTMSLPYYLKLHHFHFFPPPTVRHFL